MKAKCLSGSLRLCVDCTDDPRMRRPPLTILQYRAWPTLSLKDNSWRATHPAALHQKMNFKPSWIWREVALGMVLVI